MTLVRIAAVASLALVVAALGGVARPEAAQSADEATPAGLTVTGLGSVRTVPDRASFSFGVETQAATARAALTQNAAEAKKLLDALRAAGIAAADLQTSQVSLNPRTDERGTGIVGYSAITTVTATLRDLSRAGAVVDAAVDAGANTVSGPSLTRGDTDAQYRQALRLAYADARTKAEALAAAAAGKTLGAVTAIVESSSGSVPYAVAKDAAASTAVEIAPGTQSVDAVVTVTFALS
jgi:uncharacterized protein